MINFILISFILNILFTKRDHLYCGLFGWVGGSVEHFSLEKIKVLGIQNDDRGGDGFGMYNGTRYFKSITPRKFTEGLTKDRLSILKTVPTEIPLYMGHTRKKSRGYIDLDHTQPIVDKVKEGDKMRYLVLTHNGTISNLPEVAKELGLPAFEKPASMSDTQMLTSMIHQKIVKKESIIPILELYEGAASLAFYDSREPGVLFLFRGESKSYPSAATFTDERPLFLMKHGDKGYYYSSLKDSLDYIVDTEEYDDVVKLKGNVLFRIEGNNITEVSKVDRTKTITPEVTVVKRGSFRSTPSDFNRNPANRDVNIINPRTINTSVDKENPTLLPNGLRKDPNLEYLDTFYSGISDVTKKFNNSAGAALGYIATAYLPTSIFTYAKVPERVKQGRVYYYRGRYIHKFRQNNGICTRLAHGRLFLDAGGFIIEKDATDAREYGFVWGAMVPAGNVRGLEEMSKAFSYKNMQECPNTISDFQETYKNREDLRRLLAISLYPVAPLFRAAGFMIILNKQGYPVPYSGNFEPKFSDTAYIVKEGLVTGTYLHPAVSRLKESSIEKHVATTPPRELVLCQECVGESILCNGCDGVGYVTQAENEARKRFIENVKQKQKENKQSAELSIVEKDVLKAQDKALEEGTNLEVMSSLRNLSSFIEESRNRLVDLGADTDLLDNTVSLFDETEQQVLTLLGYES